VLAAALCAIIGAVAGLLGIGGGELRLPVLVSFLALSVKLAITVNLAISVATLGTSLIRRLLRPGGRVIVNEHAWDRLDEPTARWYLEQRAATDADASGSVEQCLDEWAAEHAGLHGSAVMRTESTDASRSGYSSGRPTSTENWATRSTSARSERSSRPGRSRPRVFATSASRKLPQRAVGARP
jgi:hypothetical protein